MKRISEALAKQALIAAMVTTLGLSPMYSVALEQRYSGNVYAVNDVTHMPTVYHYDNIEGDSGRYIEATLGSQNAAVHNLYVPISIEVRAAFGKTHIQASQCHMGQLCVQELGNGDVTLYDYRYNLKNNPYRSLSQKTVYQHIKGPAHIYRMTCLNTIIIRKY